MKPPLRWMIPLILAAGVALGTAPRVARGLDTPDAGKQTSSKKKARVRGFKRGPKSRTHYVVDAESPGNEITFTSKAPRETIVGRATAVDGHLDLKPRRLKRASGRFALRWDALDTGNAQRNRHMLGPPWVDATSHPEIVFTLNRIRNIKPRGKSGNKIRANLVGTLAMNGVEKKTTIPATLVYLEPDSGKKGGNVKEGIGIRATFKVALADFNIQGRGIGQAVAARQRIKVALFLKRADKEEKQPARPAPRPQRRGARPRTQ